MAARRHFDFSNHYYFLNDQLETNEQGELKIGI